MNLFYDCSGRLGTPLVVVMPLHHRQESHQGSHLPFGFCFSGGTREIGSALTRMCMRHRSIESKLRQFSRWVAPYLAQHWWRFLLHVRLGKSKAVHQRWLLSWPLPMSLRAAVVFSLQHMRSCDHAGFHYTFMGLGQFTSNHLWMLQIPTVSPCCSVLSRRLLMWPADLPLFQDFKLCH